MWIETACDKCLILPAEMHKRVIFATLYYAEVIWNLHPAPDHQQKLISTSSRNTKFQ